MSLLVNEDGSVKTYAIVNTETKTLLDAASWVQKAHKRLVELQKADPAAAVHLTLHNLTHPSCPPWLMALVRSDEQYCLRKAEDYEAMAARVRREIDALVERASGYDKTADAWRERAETAAEPASPKP